MSPQLVSLLAANYLVTVTGRGQVAGRPARMVAVRRPGEALVYSRPLSLGMNRLDAQYRQARKLVNADQSRDLRRGFIYVWVLLASAAWLGSLVILALLAHHVSRPIQQLTAGLSELAAGNFAVRLKSGRDDEIGRAILAFNDTAGQLEQNRDRLIYLTQLASWETLARKMAHEVKNSLTPIRLTVEEMVARQSGTERKFFEQAAQIVVEEVESLERRVRAFSQFSAEPPVLPSEIDVNARGGGGPGGISQDRAPGNQLQRPAGADRAPCRRR
jgi:nitrogen fixation/metabolism regulation signal transduction histidine kinase